MMNGSELDCMRRPSTRLKNANVWLRRSALARKRSQNGWQKKRKRKLSGRQNMIKSKRNLRIKSERRRSGGLSRQSRKRLNSCSSLRKGNRLHCWILR